MRHSFNLNVLIPIFLSLLIWTFGHLLLYFTIFAVSRTGKHVLRVQYFMFLVLIGTISVLLCI